MSDRLVLEPNETQRFELSAQSVVAQSEAFVTLTKTRDVIENPFYIEVAHAHLDYYGKALKQFFENTSTFPEHLLGSITDFNGEVLLQLVGRDLIRHCWALIYGTKKAGEPADRYVALIRQYGQAFGLDREVWSKWADEFQNSNDLEESLRTYLYDQLRFTAQVFWGDAAFFESSWLVDNWSPFERETSKAAWEHANDAAIDAKAKGELPTRSGCASMILLATALIGLLVCLSDFF